MKYVALASLLLAGACASTNVATDASPRTRVAALSADYLVVQEGIKAYLLLPPCAATTLPTCKAPAVVTVLQKGNTAASSALDYAETTVVTPGANASAIELAIGSAAEAIKSVKSTKSSLGVNDMGALALATTAMELFPMLLSVAKAGGDMIEAVQFGKAKVDHWNAGNEPTDAEIAEIRARRHANDEIIARG